MNKIVTDCNSNKATKFLYQILAACLLLGGIGSVALASQPRGSAEYWQMRLQRAENFFEDGDYRKALELYKEVAESTASAHAQFQVGWIHHNGLGVAESCMEAARWYTFSASNGLAVAANNLFGIYLEGCDGINPNEAQAIRYLKQAADLGSARAQANLAELYRVGHIVEKNPFAAYELARKSVEQADIKGMVTLAEFYRKGVGVPPDPDRAFNLLQRAASMEVKQWDRSNRQVAQYDLAMMFDLGDEIPQNPQQAFLWYSMAVSGPLELYAEEARKRMQELEGELTQAEIAQARDQIRLGQRATLIATDEQLYEVLDSHIDDGREKAAVSLARDLAQKADAYGEYRLGRMYLDSYGELDRNLDEAYILFLRSCKQGYWASCSFQVETLIQQGRREEAVDLLGRVYEKMPDSDNARLTIANPFYLLGDVDTAERLVREVLVSDPINETAKLYLQQIKSETR
ncbi:tetratricopeptide repeat protein [Wenzhouxiangella limi]|uniref:Sel1 repeat family protein n=1 Tax=Wenzhouxiangella limi TaxID=2707351 RepID=A0A845V2X7_9GAMM|nr:tetratricopeptide repeat protein [Wenzhouxiangella limi]NDY96972.1 hypothetical protein [Wenzhouxiangella limi]